MNPATAEQKPKNTISRKESKIKETEPEFPELRVEPVISERRLAGSSGVPIEVSRKVVRRRRIERGRGKYSLSYRTR